MSPVDSARPERRHAQRLKVRRTPLEGMGRTNRPCLAKWIRGHGIRKVLLRDEKVAGCGRHLLMPQEPLECREPNGRTSRSPWRQCPAERVPADQVHGRRHR